MTDEFDTSPSWDDALADLVARQDEYADRFEADPICLYCDEPVTDDDMSEPLIVLTMAGPSRTWAHRECIVRQLMGGPAHIQGTCTCQGGTDAPDLGMTRRDAARFVFDHFGPGALDG